MSQQSTKFGDPAVAFAPKISSAESGLNKKNAFCIYHPIGVSVLVATWGPSCHPFSTEVACGVPLESGQGYLRVWEVRHPKQPENNGKACRLLSWVYVWISRTRTNTITAKHGNSSYAFEIAILLHKSWICLSRPGIANCNGQVLLSASHCLKEANDFFKPWARDLALQL